MSDDVRDEAIACLEECASSNAERGHCLYTWEVLQSGAAEELANEALEAVGWTDGDMGDADAALYREAAELLRGGWSPPEREPVSRVRAAASHGVAAGKWAAVAMAYGAAARMGGLLEPIARARGRAALVESLRHAAYALMYAGATPPSDVGD